MTNPVAAEPEVVAFLDMGTNSIRLLIVRVARDGAYRVLTEQKEVVRLGEGEFDTQQIQPPAMQRAINVCRRFNELASSYGARRVVAVATSAAREATNQRQFLRRLREEAGVSVRVVSGHEEARLIYHGVSSGIHLNDKRALFVDIGGGSTELIVGDQRQIHYLSSLELGAIRLTSLHLPKPEQPVSQQDYRRLQLQVRNTAVYALQDIADQPWSLAVGSSGTVENLAQISARMGKRSGSSSEEILLASQLRQVIEMLCSLPIDDRRRVPGINPERADIIIGGAAIIETIMQELKIEELRVSKRGLRDGLLVDYLARTQQGQRLRDMSVRRRSVLQLAQSCGYDDHHAQHVAQLALELFDSALEAGLHSLSTPERELLEYSAILHDIGSFVSYENQHAHTYYLIRNADLLGFDLREIGIMATISLYHRKMAPRKKHPEFAALDKEAQATVRTLSVFLRLAESLDRGHAGNVLHARLRAVDAKRVTLSLTAFREPQLELWGIQSRQDALESTLKRRLGLEVILTPDVTATEAGEPAPLAD